MHILPKDDNRHFMKMVSKDVDNACRNPKQLLFKELIAKCISDMTDINTWFFNMATLLSASYKNECVEKTYKNLIEFDKDIGDELTKITNTFS